MSTRKRLYGEAARHRRMQFMVTVEERSRIEGLAREKGCSLSEYISTVINRQTRHAGRSQT